MKALALLFGSLATLLLAGCPFESQTPLAEPSPEKTDARLVGAWIGVDEEDRDSLAVTILPFNRAEYYVETREVDGDAERYRAYLFEIGGETFVHLNGLEAGGPSPSYVFARYAIDSGGRLHLRFVGDRITPDSLDSDARGLAEFIRTHVADPALDDEDTVLVLDRGR
jgi:hypothetical protein